MIFATASVLQRLLTFNRTLRENAVINSILGLAVASFSTLHCRINDLNVHSAVFGCMILYIAHRVRALTTKVNNAKLQRDFYCLAWRGSGKIVLKYNILAMTVSLTRILIVYAGAGFACWILDSLACPQLRQIRRQIGLPWGFVLELHGWYVFPEGC